VNNVRVDYSLCLLREGMVVDSIETGVRNKNTLTSNHSTMQITARWLFQGNVVNV
jgi:hypothetical protein